MAAVVVAEENKQIYNKIILKCWTEISAPKLYSNCTEQKE